MNSIGSDIHLPDQLILFVSKDHPLANKSDISKRDLADYPMYSCFAQSKQVQAMLNEAVDSFNKSSSIKVGSIEQVMDGLKKSDHIAIASIEHANSVSSDSELLLLKTNKGIAHEQLVIQTNEQVNENSHISHLLDLIEKTALSSHN